MMYQPRMIQRSIDLDEAERLLADLAGLYSTYLTDHPKWADAKEDINILGGNLMDLLGMTDMWKEQN